MGLLNKLFRNKLVTSQPPELIPPPHSPPPPGAPATMQVWDAYGRLAEIPREEWRTKVLPLNFRQQWDNPDGLANLIVSSLHDGFIIDCLEPARQLQRIDPQPHRGATLLGVVLLQLQEFGEAEQVLSAALQRHGEEGSLLTNLAKAYSG
ncbi:MAG TPA: hypothetical protein VNT26_18495, partial [Candidatus Sulfotelmatobacter sp.]|nr:hypothetical protein [Candidatus Sulfotelmatobacter sp.]